MLLVTAHDFVYALEVADVAQDFVEQVGLARLRYFLDAFLCELHEVFNVGQECVSVVEQEVLPLVELVFDDLVEFFTQFGGFDLQEVDFV